MPSIAQIGKGLLGLVLPAAAAPAPEPAPPPRPLADGRLAVSHEQLFAAVFGGGIGTYYSRFDEALRSSYEDALAMRRDAFLYDLIRHRQYPVLNVEHHIRPDNPKDRNQAKFAAELTRILDATVDMEDLRLHNLEAVFWGRAGAQLAFGRKWVNGARRVVVCEHEPIHGDKIQFTHGGVPGITIRATAAADLEARGAETFRSDRSLCLSLRDPFWRSRFTIHRHEPADADFLFEGEKAGAKFGLGLRDRLYWVWWLRQELMAWAFNALKRIGSNGNLVGFYQEGNAASQEAVLQALKTFAEHNVTAFPRRPGDLGAAFEHIEPSAVAYDVMLRFIEHLEGILRRAVVGQEMTSQGGPTGLGSGLAEVQQDVLQGINAYDAKKLAGCLNRDLLPTLIRENFGAVPFGVRLTFEREQDEMQAKLAMARTLVDLGATLDLSELAAEAGFRLVKAGTPGASEPPAATEPGGGDGPAGPGATPPEGAAA